MTLAIFASGSGSNFEAIQNACQSGTLDAKVALCISDRETPGVKDRAEKHHVPFHAESPNSYSSTGIYADAISDVMSSYDVSHIALAGYLKKIPDVLVEEFRHRMFNIHPALLPAFGGKGMYGKRVHEAAIEYGVQWSGATVHLVNERYDEGPVVLQHPVRVHPDDDADSLASRILEVEHQLYPMALQLFASGRASVDGRTVQIKGGRPSLPIEQDT